MDPGSELRRGWSRPRGRRGGVALVASLAAHAALLALVDASGILRATWRMPLPVAFVPLSAAEWEVNRATSGFSSVERERPYRFVAVPPDVERDPLRADAPPPPGARHLAERAQSVERESVSRYAAPDVERVLRVPQRAFEGVEGSGERGREPFSRKGRVGPRGAGGAPAKEPARAAAADDPLASGPEPHEEEIPDAPPFEAIVPIAGAEGGRRIVGERLPGLPTRELPRPAGGPGMDGAGEAREGDETRLDAHELTSASFWVDVRNRIEGEWQRRAFVTFSRVDPREDVYFWKQRTAVLKVALDASGELKKVEVVESSSLEFFDDVALEAIRASTYPPPPPEALAQDGVASIQVRITWVPSMRGSLR